MMRSLLCVLISGLCAVPVISQPYSFEVDTFDATLSDGTDVVVNQLYIDFINRYTGSQLLIELDAGEIINVPLAGLGSDVAPLQLAVDLFPDLAYDTFIAHGAFRAEDQQYGYPALGGSAINLAPSGGTTRVFNDPTKISQAYSSSPGNLPTDQTRFAVAQLVFTTDAHGTFAYLGSAEAEFFVTREGSPGTSGEDLFFIENGQILPVPEPATAGVLVLAVLGAARLRVGLPQRP